jgi:hypothetical protein
MSSPVMQALHNQRLQEASPFGRWCRRVAERVAEQMGCTPGEARRMMDAWDDMHMIEFCVGNSIPRNTLH